MKEYFKFDPKTKSVMFIGDKLEVFVPEHYEKYGCLVIDSVVVTLGIFDMVINDSVESGYLLPALIHMRPSETATVKNGNDPKVKLTFYKGDIFMYTEIVKNPTLAYVMFDEFVVLGRHLKFMKYNNTLFMFDRAPEITGINFRANHAIFEMVFSYIYRDKKDIKLQYRNTDMINPPRVIALREVAHIGASTTSKLLGNYFGNAVNSALVNQSDENFEVEELLRK